MAGGPFTPFRFSLDAAALKAALGRIEALVPPTIGRALEVEAFQRIYRPSQQLVPVGVTGRLKRSGRVSAPSYTKNSVYVSVSYGERGIPYAVMVHEIPPPPGKSPKGRSASHAAGTGYKFLERPARAAVNGMEGRVAASIQEALARGAA